MRQQVTPSSDVLGARLRPGGVRTLVALEAALAAVLGAIALGHRSYWLDESVSVTIAKLNWSGFTHVVKTREANMALYHLLLSGWTDLFGDSEAATRSLSVLVGAAAVPVLFLLGRRLAGTTAGLVAGLLLAVNPMFVRYAQEARGYALCLLLVTTASYLFVRGLQEPSWATWVAYAAVAALAAYAHFFALLVPAASAVSLLFLRGTPLPWRKILGAAVLLGLLLLPLVVLVSSNTSSGIGWASGNRIGRVFKSIHHHPPLVAAVLVVGGLCLVAAWLGLRRALGRRFGSPAAWSWGFVGSWIVVPFVVVAVLGVVYRPLFVLRYFIVCLPAVMLAGALLVGAVRRRWLAASLLAALVAVSVVGTARWYRNGQNEDWRHATRYVLGSARPGDGVLFYAPYVRIPFTLYLDRGPRTGALPAPVYPAAGWFTPAIRFNNYVPVTATGVTGAARRFKRVWLVVSHAQLYGGRDPGYDAVRAGLAADGLRLGPARRFSGVRVVRYQATR
ncbi:MAG: hypothetical protein C5B48_14495 [Candidatus Rokuibacteriota bacterium]|nr:MAG: hypothetical protein C5B48_14495 [Candidatus Rokubacteria bacterium]